MFNAKRLSSIESRLGELETARRLYKHDIEGCIEKLDGIRRRLEVLEGENKFNKFALNNHLGYFSHIRSTIDDILDYFGLEYFDTPEIKSKRVLRKKQNKK